MHGETGFASARSTAGTSRSTASALRPKKSRSRLAVNVAASDQGSAARERELARLLEPGDNPGHLLLERRQHLRGVRMAPQPVGPSAAQRRRQNKCVEELAELIRVDVVADVVVRPLAEHLLVHAGAIDGVVQVVCDRRPAPADVEWRMTGGSFHGQMVSRLGQRSAGGGRGTRGARVGCAESAEYPRVGCAESAEYRL
jgi:hypothetical protein